MSLYAVVGLGHFAVDILADYRKQKSQGKDPIFIASNIKGLKNAEVWTEEYAEQFREEKNETINV